MSTLIGPFAQLVTLDGLPPRGPLSDERLEIIPDAGIIVDGTLNGGGRIVDLGTYAALAREHPGAQRREVEQPTVCLPGLVDAHTHLCWAGSRAQDFAMRNAGKTYHQMAQQGGGIRATVRHTRAASDEELSAGLTSRLEGLRAQGITTVECKSGYGLTVEEELRHLRLIREAFAKTEGIDGFATCLAAHVCPPEFEGDAAGYLAHVRENLWPLLQPGSRLDVFAEPSAFWGEPLETYLAEAAATGFQLTVHADQFTPGGAALAARLGAASADHLEHADEAAIQALATSDTVAVALPGASIGLGEPYAPARKLLDRGASLAISSDWNPGSAPQGLLLAQATALAAAEKLTNAEVLAGITVRAAGALRLSDRGRLAVGLRADVSLWPTRDYREVTWCMGGMAPRCRAGTTSPAYRTTQCGDT